MHNYDFASVEMILKNPLKIKIVITNECQVGIHVVYNHDVRENSISDELEM